LKIVMTQVLNDPLELRQADTDRNPWTSVFAVATSSTNLGPFCPCRLQMAD
jgi:hypothetical protein